MMVAFKFIYKYPSLFVRIYFIRRLVNCKVEKTILIYVRDGDTSGALLNMYERSRALIFKLKNPSLF